MPAPIIRRLPTAPPFHLEATVRVLQRRAANLVDRWDGAHYRRVLPMADERVLVEVSNSASIDSPRVQLCVRSLGASALTAGTAASAVSKVRRILGLDLPAAALQARLSGEPRLGPLAVALRGMRPPRYPDLFEAFANVVPFQQLSIDAGVAVVAGLVERFGEKFRLAGQRYYAFPQADVIARCRDSSLRACGLSWTKAGTLREVARRIDAGSLTASGLEVMGTDEALAQLTAIPGIGPWSAALVLLRGLGRLEVFPPQDVGAIGSLLQLMRLRSPRSLQRVIRRFNDQRGYLYFCGIGGRLLAARLIRPAPARGGPGPLVP